MTKEEIENLTPGTVIEREGFVRSSNSRAEVINLIEHKGKSALLAMCLGRNEIYAVATDMWNGWEVVEKVTEEGCLYWKWRVRTHMSAWSELPMYYSEDGLNTEGSKFSEWDRYEKLKIGRPINKEGIQVNL